MDPLLSLSYKITGLPTLGASLNLVFRCMMLLNTSSSKCRLTSLTTWLQRRSLPSYIVIKMPSISNSGFKRFCTIFTVLSNLPSPSNAKNSVCTGTTTLSAATRAFTVIRPREGEQSITIKSYWSFTGYKTFFKIISLLGWLIISISAPTRSMCDGIKSR